MMRQQPLRTPGLVRRQASSPFGTIRTTALTLAHTAAVSISSVAGMPIGSLDLHGNVPEAEGANRWVLGVVSIVLVLLGGAFAGLTIALMGQDSIYLQVLAGDPNEAQNKSARRVYRLLQRGKHWYGRPIGYTRTGEQRSMAY